LKIVVTGANGQLGYDTVRVLSEAGHKVIPADLPDIDITDKDRIQNLIVKENPDAVIHLAAYVAVDKAEEERDLCYDINVKGTSYIAEVCGKLSIPVLYTSTDYVFSGRGTDPYEIDSPVGPENQYGFTKLMGEKEIRKYCSKYFIVRISWVFGINGKNFVNTIIELSSLRESLDVVCDQVGSPTYTADLAVLIKNMIESDKYGIYHATNEGFCSWSDFAEEIIRLTGADTFINPVLSSEYKTAAVRPHNSRLSKESLDRAGFDRLPDWHDALRNYLVLKGVINDCLK
jgi:dTDP-4-dehydrorhamnose reductase